MGTAVGLKNQKQNQKGTNAGEKNQDTGEKKTGKGHQIPIADASPTPLEAKCGGKER